MPRVRSLDSDAGMVLAGFMLVAMLSCERAPADRKAHEPDTQLSQAALVHYADLAFAQYSDAAQLARALLSAVDKLTTQPSAATLADARSAWLAARVPYAQTEAFRFYDGPIDRLEMLVNTWPIDENYVDSDDPASPGVIQAQILYPTLSAELLSKLNAEQGETSISTGFHVIEFLLWGKDTDPAGPGQRSYLDFVDSRETPAEGGAQELTSAKLALGARRARYLGISAELLVQHLDEVAAAWRPQRADNYRAHFLALPPAQALSLVIKGMGTLSGPELSGERLTVAYETKDQENEHSCFSDNTRDDLVGNALGIQNVCLGRYVRVDGSLLAGPSLCGLLARSDAVLAGQLTREIEASVQALQAIPAPFDQALLGSDQTKGRLAIARSIRALHAQAQTLTRAASRLDAQSSLVSTVGP